MSVRVGAVIAGLFLAAVGVYTLKAAQDGVVFGGALVAVGAVLVLSAARGKNW